MGSIYIAISIKCLQNAHHWADFQNLKFYKKLQVIYFICWYSILALCSHNLGKIEDLWKILIPAHWNSTNIEGALDILVKSKFFKVLSIKISEALRFKFLLLGTHKKALLMRIWNFSELASKSLMHHAQWLNIKIWFIFLL